jgi:flagellar basal body P-ring formation protein FlgA
MLGGKTKLLFPALVFLIAMMPQPAWAASAEAEIKNFIKQIYADSEIQVVFAQLPPALRDTPRLKNISFAKVPDPSGDGICLVGIEGKNGAESSVYVPFKVLVNRRLYMVKHDIAKGEAIHLIDLAVKETYLNGSGGAYPEKIEDVLSKTAKKEIHAGEIITKQLLEDRMAVQKGETVNVIVENTRLLVQAKGVALEKGRMGDLVRVKSASGKEVIGRVSGNDSVVVEF